MFSTDILWFFVEKGEWMKKSTQDNLDFDNAKYLDNPLFDVDEEKVDQFDKNFPKKEKEVRDTQLKF